MFRSSLARLLRTTAVWWGMPVLLIGLAGAVHAAPAFPNYRDLQLYTTSAPVEGNPAKIAATITFVNRGAALMKLGVTLKAEQAVGFAGGKSYMLIPPGKSAAWTWSFSPPAGLQRAILTGGISLSGAPERDLFIAVQGPDPAELNNAGAERIIELITERARVVATYAPRSQASIQAEMKRRAANVPKPVLTLAAKGNTAYSIVAEALPAPAAGKEALAFWQEAKLAAPEQELAAAVADLREYTRRLTDAELPIAAQATGPAIRLRVADLGPAAKGLQDAYRLKVAGRDILIEGANLDGLRNGIYGLLTDHMGCRWFMPRQLGEVIPVPKDRTVRLPALDEVKGSRWFSTNGITWGYDTLWDRRCRTNINRGRMNFGHAWWKSVV